MGFIIPNFSDRAGSRICFFDVYFSFVLIYKVVFALINTPDEEHTGYSF